MFSWPGISSHKSQGPVRQGNQRHDPVWQDSDHHCRRRFELNQFTAAGVKAELPHVHKRFLVQLSKLIMCLAVVRKNMLCFSAFSDTL